MSLSGFVTLYRDMESGVLSSDYPFKKDAPEDKDPPEGKKLPILSGPCLSKVMPSSSWSIASCNVDVTTVLKQTKRSFTKNCYTKLTPAQRYEIFVYCNLIIACLCVLYFIFVRILAPVGKNGTCRRINDKIQS